MNRKIKPVIAFFGSSLVSAYWNGAATYYRGIIKNLNRLGYEITFYEPDAYERQQNRDIPDPEWAKVVVYRNDKASLDKALEEASSADIIVKASGVGVFDTYLEKAVLELRKPDQLVIFWDVDAPATLDSVFSDANAPFRKLVPEYDLILTYGGGDPVVKKYRLLGARECIPVYNALDPETHFPVQPEERFASDLSFLGNRLPDREARVKEFFLDVAAKKREKIFVLGGSGWNDTGMPSNVKVAGHVFSRDHNAFNCSSTFVLNISRQSMADYGFSPATRVFEAAGAGTCIITDSWEGINSFFEPGREILVARNGNEVGYFMEDIGKEEAYEIGLAARKRVLADHTYRQRANLLDKILSSQSVMQH
ncbi:MAG TPA: glycosyltransferase [Bacteroidales bacterium]|nr:glycosyltransferase [Bacteroidales bacterium]